MSHRHRRPPKLARRATVIEADAHPAGHAFELALHRASLLSDADRAELLPHAQAGFAALRTGTGGPRAWAHVVDALNLAEALADRCAICTDRLPEIRAGLAALTAIADRAATSACWTLRGCEIAALDTALMFWAIQLDFCSRGELGRATAYVIDRARSAQHQTGSGGHARVIDPTALPTGAPA